MKEAVAVAVLNPKEVLNNPQGHHNHQQSSRITPYPPPKLLMESEANSLSKFPYLKKGR